ncbi:Glucans biosynthesis glucosyltransferase [Trichinella spiralis]|uniref:Glucans biosynthesis glucosyltransferase n=1 Tax=Trichinella spiralis TaxID=6334 RepID=A0ABR3KBQ7_TRISP
MLHEIKAAEEQQNEKKSGPRRVRWRCHYSVTRSGLRQFIGSLSFVTNSGKGSFRIFFVIFTMLFSYLTISFSLLFHTIVSTPLQWESGHNSKPASSFIDSSKANVKFCFESEPCLFGQYKEQHNDLLAYVKIPSWCVCMDDQKCLASRWDRNKKAEIYTCQPILR